MGKTDPKQPTTPSNLPEPSLADLFAEFKKNQAGNQRIEDKLKDIESKNTQNTKEIKEHIERYEDDISDLKAKYDSADTRLDEVDEKFDQLSIQLKELATENMLLRKRVYQLERTTKACADREEELKRQNILIQGISESPYKKTKADVTELLKFVEIDVNNTTVTSIYRIGPKPKNQNRCRPVKVKFGSTLSKQDLFKNIKKLKDSDKWKNIGINDDLSEEKLSKQRDLRALAALARTKGQTAQQRGDFLILNEQKFSYRDIDDLPFHLSLEEAKLRPTKDGFAFQGPHVYLSNLADAPFDDDGTPYRNMEEYYQCKHAHTPGTNASGGCCANVKTHTKLSDLVKKYTSMRHGKPSGDQQWQLALERSLTKTP